MVFRYRLYEDDKVILRSANLKDIKKGIVAGPLKNDKEFIVDRTKVVKKKKISAKQISEKVAKKVAKEASKSVATSVKKIITKSDAKSLKDKLTELKKEKENAIETLQSIVRQAKQEKPEKQVASDLQALMRSKKEQEEPKQKPKRKIKFSMRKGDIEKISKIQE